MVLRARLHAISAPVAQLKYWIHLPLQSAQVRCSLGCQPGTSAEVRNRGFMG